MSKKPIIIGIDASRSTVGHRTGTEGYSLQIIRHLIAVGAEYRFRLYFRDQPADGLFPITPNIESIIIEQNRLWTHLGLRKVIIKNPPDVLFVPAHVLPYPNTSIPTVVTTHDLGYVHYPGKHPLMQRLYLDWSTRYSTRSARRIIAVSKATAHDLISLNHIPEDKVVVIHSGVDDLLKPISDKEELARVRAKHSISSPYLLHIGSLQPRKNLIRLVEAFDIMKDVMEDLVLVLAGQQGWGVGRLKDRIKALKLERRVILPGYVPDDDLAALYSGASAYVFPSLYEGFGLPILEAFACDTPVICANTSSLPELTGDAAMLVAPTDVQGLAEAINQVLNDSPKREELIRRGRERVKRFTWQKSAEKTLEVLLETATI